MNKNSGFTLIELVVVIVILGILAATAAPKFINLEHDANAAKLSALYGTLKEANGMTHIKWQLDNSVATGSVCNSSTAPLGFCVTDQGYIAASEKDLASALSLNTDEWYIYAFPVPGIAYIRPKIDVGDLWEDCAIQYIVIPDQNGEVEPIYWLGTSNCGAGSFTGFAP